MMTKYSDFIKQGNEVCYYGRKVVIDEILDYTFEDIPTGEKLNEAPNLYFAGVIYDDMTTETVPVCRLKPLRRVVDLTEIELCELRKQIRVGSLSYKDYTNTLGVERGYLSDVCDAYLEAIENNECYEWLTKDSPKNFAEYCMDYCCY